jgi:hypothetical protein
MVTATVCGTSDMRLVPLYVPIAVLVAVLYIKKILDINPPFKKMSPDI